MTADIYSSVCNLHNRELAAWIDQNGPLQITFNAGAESIEDYPQLGIQAVLSKIIIRDDDNEVCQWVVDYGPFEAPNKLLEDTNYYDTQGVARKMGSATCFYKPQDKMYMDIEQSFSKYVGQCTLYEAPDLNLVSAKFLTLNLQPLP